MSLTSSPTSDVAGPALDNRRIAAAAIDLAAPLLGAVALYLTDLLTPATALVLVGWTLYYFFALESGGGQTLGKRAMNLKVVSADGGEATMRQYAMRTVARVVDTPMIGLVAMLASGDKRQRLGDVAARTSVIDVHGDQALTREMDAFDAAHLHTGVEHEPEPAQPAEHPEPAKPKRSRPGLGGPELKMPSLRRSKAPKAPKEPKAPKPAGSGRKTLGGPELKMPSLRRSKAPKEPKAPKPAGSGRKTLGGPEIKMPSFGRRKQQPVAPPPPVAPPTPAPEQAAPAPEPVPAPRAPEPPAPAPPAPSAPPMPASEPPAPAPAAAGRPPVPEVKPFDPFAEDAPEPSVEVVSHGVPAPPPEPPEPVEPEILDRDVPDVEIVRDTPDEPPAPAPVPPSQPPPPAAGRPPIPAIETSEPVEEPVAAADEDLEPEHVEGVRDDGSSRVHVKPIETVSAMDLLMRESEQQDQRRS